MRPKGNPRLGTDQDVKPAPLASLHRHAKQDRIRLALLSDAAF